MAFSLLSHHLLSVIFPPFTRSMVRLGSALMSSWKPGLTYSLPDLRWLDLQLAALLWYESDIYPIDAVLSIQNFEILFLLYVYECLPACLSVCSVCMCVECWGGCQKMESDPLGGSYKWWLAVMPALGIETESSGRVDSALNSQLLTLDHLSGPEFLILNTSWGSIMEFDHLDTQSGHVIQPQHPSPPYQLMSTIRKK